MARKLKMQGGTLVGENYITGKKRFNPHKHELFSNERTLRAGKHLLMVNSALILSFRAESFESRLTLTQD